MPHKEITESDLIKLELSYMKEAISELKDTVIKSANKSETLIKEWMEMAESKYATKEELKIRDNTIQNITKVFVLFATVV
jgi:vesicle coat complex subunit